MHLAICLFRHFPDSGLSRDMLRIASSAMGRGHRVSLFTGSWEGPELAGANLIRVPVRGLTNHGRARSYYTHVQSLLQQCGPDLVLGFNKMPGLDVYFAGDSCFVSRAHQQHSSLYRITPRYLHYSRYEDAVFSPRSATQVLSISPAADKDYRCCYLTADDRFHFLPPGLDPLPEMTGKASRGRAEMRAELGVGKGELLVLLVGSGFRTKGLDRAISALSGLPHSLRSRTRLLVVGRGHTATYQRQADVEGVGGRLTFAGARDDVPELLEAADLLLHPAYAELAGAVLLEALRAGLPILVSHVCGYAWHVEKAAAGKVLRPATTQQELTATLADMLQSPDRQQWSENGRRYAAATDFYSRADKAVDILESLSAGEMPVSDTKHEDDGELYVSGSLAAALPNVNGFAPLFNIQGEVYREGPGRTTLRFSASGRDYFLKRHSGIGWREVFKNLMYLRIPVTGAANEWRGVHKLAELGIDTLEPVAYGWRGSNPATRQSLIITEALPPSESLEDYCASWGESRSAKGDRLRMKWWLIRRLAEIARTLHRNGANHRDFYLCHFHLLTTMNDGESETSRDTLHVIDLHRMQLRRRTPSRWAIKDVSGLWFSSMDAGLTFRDCVRFILTYSGHTSLRELSAGQVRFWHRVDRRARKMRQRDHKKRSNPAVSS